MLRHSKLGIIYLAQARTASTGIKNSLAINYGFHQVGGHHEYSDEALLTKPVNPKYRAVISGVRRHRSAVASFWRRDRWEGRLDPELTTSAWLDHFFLSNVWVRDHRLYWRFLPITTHVYRFEHLLDDFNRILVSLGLEPIALMRPLRDRYDRDPGFTEDDLARIDDYFAQEAYELENRFYQETE